MDFFFLLSLGESTSLCGARRSLRPESTSRRRLFEQSEFLSHLRVRARITSPVWTSIHPVWRRCSSFSYEESAQSSRLARQASHHPHRGSYSCANPDSGRRRRHPEENDQNVRQRRFRPFAVLTYYHVRCARQSACGLADRRFDHSL